MKMRQFRSFISDRTSKYSVISLLFCLTSFHPLAAAIPTLWIIGDSTVKSGGTDGKYGWGEEIEPYFDLSKLHINNQAIGGRSSRTFRNEGRWDTVLKDIQPGDFVFMQFGHNDGGPLDETGKFRGSLKGTGEETKAIAKPDGSSELVHTYGWYMRHYAQEAEEKGASVVIFSPIPHKRWNGTTLKPDFTDYGAWAEQTAQATNANFVNLTHLVSEEYQKLGPEAVNPLFSDPETHTTKAGAELNARCVILGIRALPNHPFERFLLPDAARDTGNKP